MKIVNQILRLSYIDCKDFLTFMLFGGSCKQSVEYVVVSFTRVLTYHSILQENAIINTFLECGSKNGHCSQSILAYDQNADPDRLPSPANLTSSESRRTK